MIKELKMMIGTLIWNTAESLGFSLGKLAPTIFGWMIGVKGVRVDAEEQEKEN